MDVDTIVRRLRGAVGNAVVWGGAWFIGTLAVSAALGIARDSFSWTQAWQMAARVGVMGGLASAAFSGVVGFLYRGRRLSDISWVRFGAGGGVVAGLAVPAIMFVGRLVSGDGPLPMGNWISSALVAAIFGSVAAGGSLKLAQRVNPRRPGRNEDQLDRSDSVDRLPSAKERDAR